MAVRDINFHRTQHTFLLILIFNQGFVLIQLTCYLTYSFGAVIVIISFPPLGWARQSTICRPLFHGKQLIESQNQHITRSKYNRQMKHPPPSTKLFRLCVNCDSWQRALCLLQSLGLLPFVFISSGLSERSSSKTSSLKRIQSFKRLWSSHLQGRIPA